MDPFKCNKLQLNLSQYKAFFLEGGGWFNFAFSYQKFAIISMALIFTQDDLLFLFKYSMQHILITHKNLAGSNEALLDFFLIILKIQKRLFNLISWVFLSSAHLNVILVSKLCSPCDYDMAESSFILSNINHIIL